MRVEKFEICEQSRRRSVVPNVSRWESRRQAESFDTHAAVGDVGDEAKKEEEPLEKSMGLARVGERRRGLAHRIPVGEGLLRLIPLELLVLDTGLHGGQVSIVS